MYHTAVIADDFTSVTDCTIPFACRGLSTAALLSVPGGALPKSQVIGLNTDSRTCSREEAWTRNLAAARLLRAAGCRWVYKSVDSTLRGNLGAEIDGVMDGMGFETAIIAPAFPHYGRTTVGGVHYLNGSRLEDSPIARDPSCPARDSKLTRILTVQSRRRAACLGLGTVRGPIGAFARAIEELRTQGYELIVLDAETESDLAKIAQHAAMERCLVVGSTGLARHMARQWCAGSEPGRTVPTKTQKPIIVAAASVSPVTAGQVECLLREGRAERCLVSPQQAVFGDVTSYAAQSEAILREGRDLVLQVDASPQARLDCQMAVQEAGLSQNEAGQRITASLSSLAKYLMDRSLSEGLVMTGGDMAQALLRAFDCPGMELWGEVEPGIPAGRLMGAAGYLAVTKAGAFGTEQALCAARRYLRQEVS